MQGGEESPGIPQPRTTFEMNLEQEVADLGKEAIVTEFTPEILQSGPTLIEETKVEEAKLEETKEAQPAGTSKETHVDTSRPEPNRKKKSRRRSEYEQLFHDISC